jgi:hypothetical protein
MADISKPVGGENLTSTDFSAIIEMASEDFFVFLSVVFKKFGLIANEFLSGICQFLNAGIINLSLDFYISHFGNKAINGFCNSVRFIGGFFR